MRLSGLYAITPDQPDTTTLLRQVEQALRGGIRLLQYRNKTTVGSLRREQATRLLALCREFGAKLIVNDDVVLALAIGADGAHLGSGDGDLAAARVALGPGKLLGVSCYDDLSRAREAVSHAADYVAFGSFFASSTKPGAVRASPDLLRQARAELNLPTLQIAAIGGINIANAPQLIAAGADLLAVMNDIFDAPDICASVAAYDALFSAMSAEPRAL